MPEHGEICWVFAKDIDVTGSEQQKSRPYVIVSRDVLNQVNRTVVGVPLSTRIEKASGHRILIPLGHIIQDPACQRPMSDSVALTDHIRVLDKTRFENPKMGKLSDTAMGGIENGLAFLFDIRI